MEVLKTDEQITNEEMARIKRNAEEEKGRNMLKTEHRLLTSFINEYAREKNGIQRAAIMRAIDAQVKKIETIAMLYKTVEL